MIKPSKTSRNSYHGNPNWANNPANVTIVIGLGDKPYGRDNIRKFEVVF